MCRQVFARSSIPRSRHVLVVTGSSSLSEAQCREVRSSNPLCSLNIADLDPQLSVEVAETLAKYISV
jgi:hypothetical protein